MLRAPAPGSRRQRQRRPDVWNSDRVAAPWTCCYNLSSLGPRKRRATTTALQRGLAALPLRTCAHVPHEHCRPTSGSPQVPPMPCARSAQRRSDRAGACYHFALAPRMIASSCPTRRSSVLAIRAESGGVPICPQRSSSDGLWINQQHTGFHTRSTATTSWPRGRRAEPRRSRDVGVCTAGRRTLLKLYLSPSVAPPSVPLIVGRLSRLVRSQWASADQRSASA